MNQSCSSPRFVACALSAVLLKFSSTLNLITAALVLFACVVAAATQSDDPAFAKFKRGVIAKVGQKITVVGTLSDGKEGFWLAFNHWGAYIHATKESDLAKDNDLYARFRSGQTVKVTGTLRYRPGPKCCNKETRANRANRA